MQISLIVALALAVGLVAFAIPGFLSLPMRQAWCRVANRPYSGRRDLYESHRQV